MRTFGKCQGGGRRTAARAAAPLIAVLTTVARSYGAILVDLSCTGAKLHGTNLPPAGEDILVKIDSVEAFATVVWSSGGECGVAFANPLSPGETKRLSERARKATRGGLSAEESAALEEWKLGIAH